MARTVRRSNIEWLNLKSAKSTEYPIIVNTAGGHEASFPFETLNENGREDFYLIYVVGGELLLDMPNFKRAIGQGTAFIIPPKHMYKYSGNASTRYLFAHFTGSYAERFLKECGFDSLPCIVENDFSVEIQSKFNLLIDAFLRSEQLSIQRCACLLQDVLLDISVSALSETNNSPIKASLKYIHSFFTEAINIPYLASLENLSNSRYLTVFKKHMGKTPNEYIIKLRLKLATNMLLSTNMSIKQISERVGYHDQYFFSRLFKRHIGMSPQDYRNKAGLQ